MVPSKSSILRFRSTAAPRVRFFCFPHAGGSASEFWDWGQVFSNDIEVCAIQYPGRGARIFEPPLLTISAIIDAATAAISRERNTPVVLFGHSFGALVAFEVARCLSASDINVTHLFVSGQSGPQLPDREPPMRHLRNPEFLAEMCRRYDGIPQEILQDKEMVELFLPPLRADIAMKETYRYEPGPALRCKISAFGGDQDASVTLDELAAWRDQTVGGFKMRMLPGNHFFTRSARRGLLQAIAEDLGASNGCYPRLVHEG